MKTRFVTVTMIQTHALKLEVEIPKDITAEQVSDRVNNLILKLSSFEDDSDITFEIDCEENPDLDTDQCQGESYDHFINKYFFNNDN